ncbi:TPA: hypothetical protein HA278_04985 [Candidatus Woesearchaeota archaeon]|nr:hypothetical protein [Candidatus Woesearchaeota archaeon]
MQTSQIPSIAQTLPPPIETTFAPIVVRNDAAIVQLSRPGQTTSQTGIFINSGVGKASRFYTPAQIAVKPPTVRSAAQMGSADSAANSILPTVDQPVALIEIPRKSRYLIIPEQYIQGAHTLPPEEIPQDTLGPAALSSWSHDQTEIGFDDAQDPNPVEGLAPLNPVEVQDTIQPNIWGTKRLNIPKATRTIVGKYKGRNSIRKSATYLAVANAVNGQIWK